MVTLKVGHPPLFCGLSCWRRMLSHWWRQSGGLCTSHRTCFLTIIIHSSRIHPSQTVNSNSCLSVAIPFSDVRSETREDELTFDFEPGDRLSKVLVTRKSLRYSHTSRCARRVCVVIADFQETTSPQVTSEYWVEKHCHQSLAVS